MKRKHKRPPSRSEADKARTLEYRLENLALICSRVEIRMSDSFVYEVWGQLRHGPRRLGLLRLGAARLDLRAAVGQALVTAVELERSYLPHVSSELTEAIAGHMSDEDIRAASAVLVGNTNHATQHT